MILVTRHLFVAIVQLAISMTASLRMAMLEIPSPTTYGENVQLICAFELDDDQLYSVKWYKSDVEFYRYVPNDWPPGQFMPLPGIDVNLGRSNDKSVFLRHVNLSSAGKYRCEVSAEAPFFQTVEAEKEMKVYVLPAEGPKITGSQSKYQVGDTVLVNCTSAKSKPAATLKWFINDELVGPECETEHSTTLHADGLEGSSLGLRFLATDKYFRHGNMKLKCTATISMVYTMSNEELVFGGRQQTSGLHVTQNANIGQLEESTSSTASVTVSITKWTLFLYFSLVSFDKAWRSSS